VNDLKEKLREILGDLPIGTFAFRRAATYEESKEWDAEGVVVNPSSLDDVIEEAIRRIPPDAAAGPRSSAANSPARFSWGHPTDAGAGPRSGPPAGSGRR
jgi:hypothetical protein